MAHQGDRKVLGRACDTAQRTADGKQEPQSRPRLTAVQNGLSRDPHDRLYPKVLALPRDIRPQSRKATGRSLNILIQIGAMNSADMITGTIQVCQSRHDESAVSLRLGGGSADHTVQTR